MRAGGGSERAFEALYTAHYQAIAGYVRRRVAAHEAAHEADDVIAQIFTVAWRRFDQVPAPPGDRLWLFGVARNSVADQRRSERRRLHLQARLSQDAMSTAPAAWTPGSLSEPVRAALRALRPADREALQLVLWDELSHAEAAAVLGCSRLLGPMTDPLGRPGYGLAAGPNGLSFAGFNPVQAAVIDPHTGSLLATEDIGPMAPNVQCETLDATGPAAGSGKPVATVHLPRRTITATCIGSSYEGRSYRNQVDDYTVLVSAGWTNASPALPPSTHEDPLGTPGALPPVGL